MNQEIKICQNCKKNFTIEPEDFKFYKKISVPPPTWCPECRMKRRMLFRNEFNMYKYTCLLCGKEGISHFSKTVKFPVYCNECWWSDKWNPLDYGREFDSSKSFFDQWKELSDAVPRPSIEAYQNENSPYSDYTWFSKNVYLSPSTISSDNVSYSKGAWSCRDTFDSMVVQDCESVYEVLDSEHCVNCKWISECKDCLDSSYIFDCRNCSDCFMSSNLRNKKFVFRNKQLTKEEYRTKLSAEGRDYRAQRKLLLEYAHLRESSLHRYANMVKCTNSSGNNLSNCKNSINCFNSADCEDVKYLVQASHGKDMQDMYGVGDEPSSLLYEGVNVGYLDANVYFSSNTFENNARVQYCDYCRTSQDLFGCVGLRKKQYCILNKQYTKESFDKLRTKIIQHMDEMPYVDAKRRVYKYGEFFPWEFSPFAYNEAMTQFYFPIKKEEAINFQYKWLEPEKRNYKITLDSSDLPNYEEIDEDILKEIIGCEHKQNCEHSCTLAFRVTPRELEFYRRMGISMPHFCPACRNSERLSLRNSISLWHRKCMCPSSTYQNTIQHEHEGPCPNEFETTYAPERPEIVYCEKCYLREVV